MKVVLERPWLIAHLGAPLRVLSWSLNRPGFATTARIVWREVRNADLPPDLDVDAWLGGALDDAGLTDAVAFLTSRDIDRHVLAAAHVEGASATVLATVGLSNAERVGHRLGPQARAGTINIALSLSEGLEDGALVEALSLVAQARTAAVIERGPMVATGRASGTGTDCIAVAAPPGGARHAGLHTALGEAIGRATYEAVALGVDDWMREQPGDARER